MQKNKNAQKKKKINIKYKKKKKKKVFKKTFSDKSCNCVLNSAISDCNLRYFCKGDSNCASLTVVDDICDSSFNLSTWVLGSNNLPANT